jgi:hypothetical protein
MRGSEIRGKKLCERRRKKSCQESPSARHYPSFLCALGLLGAGYCPTRRGWTHCPARAGPSWIIRGACPLHNLMEVGNRGREKKRKDLDVTATTQRFDNVAPSRQPHKVSSPPSRRPRPWLRPRHGDHVRASATDTLASAYDTRPNVLLSFFSNLFLSISVKELLGAGLPHPARLDYLPSAGPSLLDYKRGVPVARPQGGLE